MGLNEYNGDIAQNSQKKTGIDISVVTGTAKFKNNYEKNRENLGMNDIVDRRICLKNWEISMKENIKGKLVEMVTMNYTIVGDESETLHTTSTESSPIKDVLKSMDENAIKIRDAEGGFITKIFAKKNLKMGLTYYLDTGMNRGVDRPANVSGTGAPKKW